MSRWRPRPTTAQHSIQCVESVENLSTIFKALDEVAFDLRETRHPWEPPRVVVIGDQSHGKSTLLERLCLMPLFPRSRAMCTCVPVKIDIRRTSDPLPASLQPWDTTRNEAIGKPRLVPLDDGHVDVREAMAEGLQGEDSDVASNRELRLTIMSPSLPPMSLVDLPILVSYPETLRQETQALVNKYVSDHGSNSIFLVVVRADSSPRTSESVRIVMQSKLENRTIGVLTFCDKLHTDEDHELLRQVLSNSKESKECVALEPFGYVATTNQEPRKKQNENNRSRLLAQARNEIRWFEEEGYAEEIAAGIVTTTALIRKIGTMYSRYVQETFLPQTLRKIVMKVQEKKFLQRNLGVSASPGNVQAADDIGQLFSAATNALETFEFICLEHRQFIVATVLPNLTTEFSRILQRSSTPILGVQEFLDDLYSKAMEIIEGAYQAIDAGWDQHCGAAWTLDPAPFRPQRFPAYVRALHNLAKQTKQTVSAAGRQSVDQFVRNALSTQSPFTRVTNLNFSPENAVAQIDFPTLARNIVVSIFTSVCSPGRQVQIESIGSQFFSVENKLRESCHARRCFLRKELTQLEKAGRRLLEIISELEVAQPAPPQPVDNSFKEHILACVGDFPRHLFDVDPWLCSVSSNDSVVTTTGNDGRLNSGGLQLQAVLLHVDGAETVLDSVSFVDQGNGAYSKKGSPPLDCSASHFSIRLYGCDIQGFPRHTGMSAVSQSNHMKLQIPPNWNGAIALYGFIHGGSSAYAWRICQLAHGNATVSVRFAGSENDAQYLGVTNSSSGSAQHSSVVGICQINGSTFGSKTVAMRVLPAHAKCCFGKALKQRENRMRVLTSMLHTVLSLSV